MPTTNSSSLDSTSTTPNVGRHLFPRKAKTGKAVVKAISRGKEVAEENGAPEAFLNSVGIVPFTIPGTDLLFTAYANGRGNRAILDSNSSFSGREAGGGSRSAIYGTSRFGSGYPYGNHGSFVSSRPFPFYFVPVPIARGYYGGNEYLDIDDTKRPGGNLVTAFVQPSSDPDSVTYRIVGDNSSVIRVYNALVASCFIVSSPSVMTAFTPSPTAWPLPEQIVQYYRASSFALSLDGYNNTASLLINAPTSNNSLVPEILDAPLPSGLNRAFLECINSTIAASVPLADVEYEGPSSGALSQEAVVGVAIAGGAGATILVALFVWLYCRRKKRHNRVSYRH